MKRLGTAQTAKSKTVWPIAAKLPRIRKLEANPLGSTPEQMRKLIQESLDTWGPVVQARKISVD